MLRVRFTYRILAGLILALLAQSNTAHAQYGGDLKGTPYVYEDIFPLGGKRIAKRGVKFPLPWGVGLNYMFMKQPIDISRIALGVNDSGMADMSEFIKFKSVDSQIQALNLRVDLWLFPFLSVYALGNYAPSTSTDIVLAEPFPLNAGAEQWVAGEGFGTTAAFGAFGFWGTMDANWTWNHAEMLDETVRTTLLSPRAGKSFGRWGTFGFSVWVGAMGQFITAETSGAIKLADATDGSDPALVDKVNAWYDDLPPAKQLVVGKLVEAIQNSDLDQATVKYDLDKKVAYRWNMLVGTQLEFSERWFLRAEVGFIQRQSFMLGFNYRFGTPGFP